MRYQIGVSGAVSDPAEAETLQKLAYELGQEIASVGATLLTGATVGLPYHATLGFTGNKSRKGASVGFSPAASYREHVTIYHLPTREFDYINFTGMEYVGRDVHLVRSCDAVITIGGRMGSLHELTTALEGRKVCGILIGSGGLADYTKTLLQNIQAPGASQVIYSTDPARLVGAVIEALDNKYADIESN